MGTWCRLLQPQEENQAEGSWAGLRVSAAPRGPEATPPPDKVEPDPPSQNALTAQVGSRVRVSCPSDITTADPLARRGPGLLSYLNGAAEGRAPNGVRLAGLARATQRLAHFKTKGMSC